MKIFELAKELGVDNKELVAKAKELGMKVSSHLSAITDEEIKKLKSEMSNKPKKEKEEKSNIKTTGNVIIRRQVIVNEEKKPAKPVRNPKEDIGFTSQRNTNYNIVYREKPTKPMSVSELFGLAPKKPAKKAEPKVNKEEVKETKVVKTEATETKKVETAKTEKVDSTTNTKPMANHGINKDAKKN